MFSYLYPKLTKDRILKKEMFINLRDYPKNFINLQLQNYSDGIITGAEVTQNDNNCIIVSSGLIKHDEQIYILKRNVQLPYYSSNGEIIVKVRFLEKSLSDFFDIYNTEIFLDHNSKIKEDEMELGRFKLNGAAKLRTDYKDIKDMRTEYNTLNIINVPYSGQKQSTISSIILKLFSKEMMKYKQISDCDVIFSMECLNRELVNRELIYQYISNKLNLEIKECSNKEIYNYFIQILKYMRN